MPLTQSLLSAVLLMNWDFSLFSRSRDFEKTLRKVELKDLCVLPRQTRSGTYIELSITESHTMQLVGFQTEGQDDGGDRVRLLIYNLPTAGTSQTFNVTFSKESMESSLRRMQESTLSKTLFKPGTLIYIKDPWLKIANDGLLSIRIENARDLAFIRSSSTCSYCYQSRADPPLKRCSRCAGAFYCGKTCQATDWPLHKRVCFSYSENNEHHAAAYAERAFHVHESNAA